MFSVMRPTMGVWMEAESTVMTVSQGISRPNGANTALNFLAGGIPAELSANKLMGESVGAWFAGKRTCLNTTSLATLAGLTQADKKPAVWGCFWQILAA
jgi:hypothetical protein